MLCLDIEAWLLPTDLSKYMYFENKIKATQVNHEFKEAKNESDWVVGSLYNTKKLCLGSFILH